MVLSYANKGMISKAFVLVFFTPFIHGARLVKTEIPESTTLKLNETTETTEKTATEATAPSTEAFVNFSAPELSSEEAYASERNACYQCQYEQQFENTVFKMLYNHSELKNAAVDACSRCREADDFSNNRKSLGCVCGIYTVPSASFKDVPLRTKMYHNVTCHEQVPFEEACKKICILGALSYNELEPITLCFHLTEATNVKAYVQSKSCRGDDEWTFTGLISPNSICCDQGMPIRC
ncbi:unnamed protein product [Phyllotreta striolata]|uniref:Uncharacterized protein n=1 Tax=Phyllotreta striolata TaxID=444603 RepID=A0A9N9XQG7_PHYSR|nr:unnamed protein product [Phyllotreta striolata]